MHRRRTQPLREEGIEQVFHERDAHIQARRLHTARAVRERRRRHRPLCVLAARHRVPGSGHVEVYPQAEHVEEQQGIVVVLEMRAQRYAQGGLGEGRWEKDVLQHTRERRCVVVMAPRGAQCIAQEQHGMRFAHIRHMAQEEEGQRPVARLARTQHEIRHKRRRHGAVLNEVAHRVARIHACLGAERRQSGVQEVRHDRRVQRHFGRLPSRLGMRGFAQRLALSVEPRAHLRVDGRSARRRIRRQGRQSRHQIRRSSHGLWRRRREPRRRATRGAQGMQQQAGGRHTHRQRGHSAFARARGLGIELDEHVAVHRTSRADLWRALHRPLGRGQHGIEVRVPEQRRRTRTLRVSRHGNDHEQVRGRDIHQSGLLERPEWHGMRFVEHEAVVRHAPRHGVQDMAAGQHRERAMLLERTAHDGLV